jgi:hypothetical protein
MQKSRAVVFPLGRTAKNPTSGLTKDCLTHRLRRILGCIGYSTDSREHTPPFPTLRSETHRLHTDPHPPETYISRVIPETILSAMHGTISDTGILHMRDILRRNSSLHMGTILPGIHGRPKKAMETHEGKRRSPSSAENTKSTAPEMVGTTTK